MQKKVKLAVLALCAPLFASAQLPDSGAQLEYNDSTEQSSMLDESAFTFTESQLGEDEDMSQTVTIMNSGSNIYSRNVGFLFSPVRFRYRAYNQRYNDIYINGVQMNDMESGQFRYTIVGGLNNLTRYYEASLPFEDNNFSMSGMGGSNNYDFRASHVSTGHKATLTGANRNYTIRGMYTYSSGLNSRGWAFTGSVCYRWAGEGYVEGTFYNSLSYYLGVEKIWKNGHALSFATWGNPTERASQGAATDESYWIANNNQYNPYWGYQNGKKRNSRIVNDFQPTALVTWDWTINNDMKLTTTLLGRYSMYKSTKLNYNNSDNPQPDYWKNLPSSYYDVWGDESGYTHTDQGLADWNTAYNFLKVSRANRQINWDRLYYSNRQASLQGADAMYYVQAKHNDNLNISLASTLKTTLTKNSAWNSGFMVAMNKGMHYQTMDDLLGASIFHNINSYALGNYDANNDYVQYDLNTAGADRKGKVIKEGDIFGYDYDLLVRKGFLWTSYASNVNIFRFMVAGKIGGTTMSRYGHMRNGMFANNSYGRSGTAKFGEGGAKGSVTANLGHGHVLRAGIGFQWNAPLASVAFVSPEMNNDFVSNLKNEKVFSSELAYQYQSQMFKLNINGYYSRLFDVTEWQNFYFDDINSFSYVSMTNIKKVYYGVELGMDIKITSNLSARLIGTISEAKNTNNANVRYMSSTKKTYTDDIVMNKDMREASTPLSAYSIGLNYNRKGWYLNLAANYYDRIYLSYSPSYRYQETLITMGSVGNNSHDGNDGYLVPEQSRGHGGWMVDGSIGKSIRVARGKTLSINLMVTNILNNQHLCTGGYEQSRSDYTVTDDGSMNNVRAYKFTRNPKKFYAYGINGMLNLTYRF